MVRIAVHDAKASVVDALDATVKPAAFKFAPLYSGGAAFIDGYDAPAYVDLATLRVDPSPKALLEHDMDAVVGRLENVVVSETRVDCDAIVGGNELAAKVVEWAKNVAQWSCSIGVYRINERDVEFIGKDAKARVNGRDIIGPAFVIHNGSLAEGSFVAIGGDGEAAAFLARFNKKGKLQMAEEKKRPEEDAPDDNKREIAAQEEDQNEKIQELDSATDAKKIIEDAVEDVVEDAGVPIPDETVDEIVEEIVDEMTDVEADSLEVSLQAAKMASQKIKERLTKQGGNATSSLRESRRVAGIKTLCAAFGKSGTRIAATAIANGWGLARTERVLTAKKRNRELIASLRNPGCGSAESAYLPKQSIVAAAFAQTLGMKPERVQKALGVDERVMNASMEKPYRDISFRGVVAASLNSFQPNAYDAFTGAASGWRDCKLECMRARLSKGASFRANAGFSTINATDIFQIVIQAFLEPSEEVAPRLYTQITRENKVTDFNEVKSYLPTIQGRLRQISETGAIQNVTFTTEEFRRSADAYAAVFTIPEKTIINDQIDAFSELLRQLEQLGDDCVEHDVAEMFWRLVDGDVKDSSSNALVSATVGNYLTSGTLDEDGLGNAIAALNSFSTANGIPLASDNLIMLVGTKLAPSALKLAQSGYVDFQNGTAYPNVFQGRFKPLEWAYFDSAHARAVKDDGSTLSLFAGDKTWVLLRDPQRRPAVCVNKVLGFESPRVEQFDADPAVWGTTYRYVYPYGVSVQYKDALVATTNI